MEITGEVMTLKLVGEGREKKHEIQWTIVSPTRSVFYVCAGTFATAVKCCRIEE